MSEPLQEPSQTTLSDQITALSPTILRDFEVALERAGSALLLDDLSRKQVLTHARDILARTAAQVGGHPTPVVQPGLAREIGADRAATNTSPTESLRAANLLFATVVRRVAATVDGPDATDRLILTALTLHEILTHTLRVAADAYVGVLLNRIHRAQIEERRHISRELHDRIGHGIGVAQRQLELSEIYWAADQDRALSRLRAAQHGLTGTLEAVRHTIAGLRLVEPVHGLEKALRLFLDSTATPELIHDIQVNGDESWVPATLIEETFLIVREALRNTVTHARAQLVMVRIDLAPDRLQASVVDDGEGFDPAAGHRGTGLLSMKERASLLGGSLSLISRIGGGTHIELRLPVEGDTG
ncbi:MULTISPECIES: sensor histidine kinase [unclassified Solwaraspora]|uniref:sensor histidine kinase n=1 Tax=unclassified Solwaraspora TaxID=2627926 RepID=UPI00259B4133|nr:ATP-binding protein [Solwaraspora sp. WMMA2056]WJK38250.1 histidine kinase [Solwaraspora sp. WMMA2056]